MDENFCENETSESVDDQKAKELENSAPLEISRITFEKNRISNRCGSSLDPSVSGPSANLPLLNYGREESETTEPVEAIETTTQEEERISRSESHTGESPEPSITGETVGLVKVASPVEENNATCSTLSYSESQHHVRLAPEVEKQLGSRKPSIGPPPSYSFVMKQKKKLKSVPSPDPAIVNRVPPPTYTGTRGVYMTPEDRGCTFPSFVDPVWRSHSQAALCPRCGILVLTTTHAHDSMATHVAALALCLFGCWPCCLIPYCMNACKNMYHYCPICQTFLGLYRPW